MAQHCNIDRSHPATLGHPFIHTKTTTVVPLSQMANSILDPLYLPKAAISRSFSLNPLPTTPLSKPIGILEQ